MPRQFNESVTSLNRLFKSIVEYTIVALLLMYIISETAKIVNTPKYQFTVYTIKSREITLNAPIMRRF